MVLSEQLMQQIEAAWGKAVPGDMSRPEWAEMIRFLQVSHPELAARVYAEISGNADEEVAEVHDQLQAQSRAKQVVQKAGGLKDEQGRVVPSRTKGLLWLFGLLGLALIPLSIWILGPVMASMFGGSPPSAVSQPQESPKPEVAPPPVAPVEQPTQPQPVETGAAASPTLPPPPEQTTSDIPSYPQPAPASSAPPAPNLPPPPPPPPAGNASVAAFPKGEQLAAASKPIEGQYAVGAAVQPAGSYSPAAPSGGAVLSESRSTGASFAAASSAGAAGFATATEAPSAPAPSPGEALKQEINAARNAQVGAPVNFADRLDQMVRRTVEDLRPGTVVAAEVVAAPLLAQGLNEAPVLLKDEQGRMWLGLARLAGASSRIELELSRVFVGRDGYLNVKARGLATDGTYAVAAKVEDVAPSLAPDLLRAAISGFSGYLSDLRNAQRFTLGPDGKVAVEKEAPPVEYQILGNIANLFNLPQGQAALVRVFRLERGQPVEILVLEVLAE